MRYTVKATVRGKRVAITKETTKKRAVTTANNLRKSLKSAIPKYKWAKNIRVVKRR